MSLKRRALFLALAGIAGVAGYLHVGGGADITGGGAPLAVVEVPAVFSPRAGAGLAAYEANCAACHGRHAAGRDGVAPPLVHAIYRSGHHGDESFQRAVADGVRSHHWHFGDMPPVSGLTRREVAAIVTYVRELQRANGIR